MKKNEVPCPGHDGECKFCKRKNGFTRAVEGMKEVDRLTGQPKVDLCCKSCQANLRYEQHTQFRRTSIS